MTTGLSQTADTRVRLPFNWKPRPYQVVGWNAWKSGVKRLLLVWHRRAGKDELALHLTAVAAHRRVANYWHCLPLYEQAKKAIWEAINPHTGRRRIDEAFPPSIRKRTDNNAMTIEFLNGSIWRVVGSDNPDSLVGAPPAGIVFSEWALANPSAWAYLAPILEENGGWAIFITTPRGRNHVKSMLDMAIASPRWFAEVLTPTQTGYPLERIEEQRHEYHSIFGQDAGDALIEQEYWCSFEAAILGAYWGREMVNAEKDGRICDLPWEPGLPVHTAWDIGVGDDTAIWCFQQHRNQVRVIDYYEANGYAMGHYVDYLESLPWGGAYDIDYVPHDAKVREWTKEGPGGLAKSRVQSMIERHRKPEVIPNQKLEDTINAGRRIIPLAIFDKTRCAKGLETLRSYQREWDDKRKVFKDAPLHNGASHGASAWRTLSMAVKHLKPIAPKPGLPAGLRGIGQMTMDELIASQPKHRARI